MSNELKEFYRAYKEWLDSGAPNYQPFERHVGLCSNITKFCEKKDLDVSVYMDIYREMIRQFRQAGLSGGFPFGVLEYHREHSNGTQHLNTARIKWVEEHAK